MKRGVRLWAPVCAVLLVALLVAVYLFDPAEGTLPYPRCLFKSLTGWDCPGCGSTRALHALLHGHVAEALSLNAAAPVGAAFAATAIFADLRGPERLRRVVLSPAMGASVVALAILWTIVRNL